MATTLRSPAGTNAARLALLEMLGSSSDHNTASSPTTAAASTGIINTPTKAVAAAAHQRPASLPCGVAGETWLKQVLLAAPSPPSAAAVAAAATPQTKRSNKRGPALPSSASLAVGAGATPAPLHRCASDATTENQQPPSGSRSASPGGKRRPRKNIKGDLKTPSQLQTPPQQPQLGQAAYALAKFQTSPEPAELPLPKGLFDDEPVYVTPIKSRAAPSPAAFSVTATCRGAERSPADSPLVRPELVMDLRKVMGLTC